jgi:serine O-acetyltransferase
MSVMRLYRFGRWCHLRGIPVIPALVYRAIFVLSGAVVPMSVEIGAGSTLAYGGVGVVLHEQARIGRRVTISPHVTLGGRCGHGGVPTIEDDCHIGAGARILGPVRIGRGARVGANAVVIKDVPAFAVAAGIPARIVRTGVRPCHCITGESEEPAAAGEIALSEALGARG